MTRAPTEMELRCAQAARTRMSEITAERFRLDPKRYGFFKKIEETWDDLPQDCRDDWIEALRAAIRAMREPTPDMEVKLRALVKSYGGIGKDWYQAGIDAASPAESGHCLSLGIRRPLTNTTAGRISQTSATD